MSAQPSASLPELRLSETSIRRIGVDFRKTFIETHLRLTTMLLISKSLKLGEGVLWIVNRQRCVSTDVDRHDQRETLRDLHCPAKRKSDFGLLGVRLRKSFIWPEVWINIPNRDGSSRAISKRLKKRD